MELVNTMLTVGVVPHLFDEAARNEVKGAFRDQCKKETGKEGGDEIWDYYCNYVRSNLHLVLCMSPAGETLRVRCRNFPGLVSSTNIDWFFAWPEEALKEVAEHYLEEFVASKEVKNKITAHMVWVHKGMPAMAEEFRKRTGRAVYQTPKNFLDFLNNFKRFFEENQRYYGSTIGRYETGLDKL